ncbi:MAG: hypothetical protein RBU37_05670 [Myxococcota bacterium]|jgi:hypothetical protein|nr:hypothetical protein [Myxococcota bacterium]
MKRAWVALAFSLLFACSSERSVVTVRLCGDLDVPLQVDSVRVSLLDGERKEKRAGIRNLLECPAELIRELPQSVELATFEGEAWVVATGLRDGVEVIRVERRVRLSSDESFELSVGLNKECIGVKCSLGQTCVEGRCALVPWGEAPLSCSSVPIVDGELLDQVEPDVEPDVELETDVQDVGVRYCPLEDTLEQEEVE